MLSSLPFLPLVLSFLPRKFSIVPWPGLRHNFGVQVPEHNFCGPVAQKQIPVLSNKQEVAHLKVTSQSTLALSPPPYIQQR